MKKKIEWTRAADIGRHLKLDGAEIAELVAAMEGYQALFGDVSLSYAHGFVMRSASEYEFVVGSDALESETFFEIHKAAGSDEHYELLEFGICVESFLHHQLSKSEDFPHNIIRFLAGEVNDHYLASDSATESELEFARQVYDALIALWEKRIFEQKFLK
ncbi:hypothetical protein [Paraburkholderia kururiensis]|uniref:hypothetical protein n=1 Tax=Paraburkholderia kururiensis TaxID=984307 RepID=UPI0003605076|nr:hypothetical protein [Paraburkholderia kururiensis]